MESDYMEREEAEKNLVCTIVVTSLAYDACNLLFAL
jgi:hypothetical protein